MGMYKITEQQKEILTGKQFAPDRFFGPIENNKGEWFISDIEIRENVNFPYEWLSDLVESEFVPKPLPQ